MTTYSVMYEQAEDGSWSASAADLPVFAVGDTREDAEREIRSAIKFHLDELAHSGDIVPEAATIIGTVDV